MSGRKEKLLKAGYEEEHKLLIHNYEGKNEQIKEKSARARNVYGDGKEPDQHKS